MGVASALPCNLSQREIAKTIPFTRLSPNGNPGVDKHGIDLRRWNGY